ncbi:ceramide galactosyltransferase [Sarotherodon galilaeus]
MKVSHATAGLVVWFVVLGCINAVTLEVKESNTTCIKADLSASFSIIYNTTHAKRTVQFLLPNSTTVDTANSTCGKNGSSPRLVAVFGSGYTFGLNFSTNGTLYQVSSLTLQYNLSDTSVFPNATISGVVTLVSASVGIEAKVNTTYKCASPTVIAVATANVNFTDMRLEAYMPGNELSPNETVCFADQTSTTPSPTTVSTTAVPTTTPPGTPQQGNYTVKDANDTICLLAKMGLQLNVSYTSQNKTVQDVLNLNPNVTNSTGSCGASSATLVLTQTQSTILTFNFTLNSTTNKYHLSGVTLLANWSDSAHFSMSNNSLNYLRSTLGYSYMCNAEQTLFVTPSFSLNTFDLQVQPFGVKSGRFATAEECQMDQNQMIIPIIVGAALAGLVLITLIAYLIGKRRSHAGYQAI